MSETVVASPAGDSGIGAVCRPQLLVGNTPVLRIGAPLAPPGRGFWAKLEGRNPGGMKDRPALHMVRRARQRGELAPGARIVESSSGTLGLGLALAGMTYGHPVTVVTDPGMEPIVARMLTAYGVTIDVVVRPHAVGGWQQARLDRVAELRNQHADWWHADQYHNPDTIDGYESLARELLDQVDRVDVLVCSVGTGGHSAGVARVLRRWWPGMKLIGVDSVSSTIFGQPAGPRLMRGLGSSIRPGNVDYTAFDEVHWVAPAQAVWACRALAETHYATGGWSVGSVALVAGWVAGFSASDTRVVAVFPDGPLRYFDTVFNDTFCAAHRLLDLPPPQQPEVISHPADRVVRTWTRCTSVVDPATFAARWPSDPQRDTDLGGVS